MRKPRLAGSKNHMDPPQDLLSEPVHDPNALRSEGLGASSRRPNQTAPVNTKPLDASIEGLLVVKRRGGDSNPRDGKPSTGFRDRRVQPLCHLSGWDLLNCARLGRSVKSRLGYFGDEAAWRAMGCGGELKLPVNKADSPDP